MKTRRYFLQEFKLMDLILVQEELEGESVCSYESIFIRFYVHGSQFNL